MKKVISLLIACLVLVMSIPMVSTAAAGITESPNIKIVIDGQLGAYPDVPLIVGGRTMLPLRGLLIHMGVPDDEQHIAWNASDKRITIVKDDKTIVLQVNNNTATVNNQSVILDSAPLIYKNRTYIPAKFVAQSLGKKVVWDGGSSTVLIRDEAEFNRVKDILEKSNAATRSVKTVRSSLTMQCQLSGAQNTKLSSLAGTKQMTMEVDQSNKLVHNVLDLGNMKVDMYQDTKYLYMCNMAKGQWVKVRGTDDFFKQIEQRGYTDISDAMCAGFTIDESVSGIIRLKGNICEPSTMQSFQQQLGGNAVIQSVYMEMELDKATFLPTKYDLSITASAQSSGKTVIVAQDSVSTYYDYNSDIQIFIPNEALRAPESGN